MFAEYMKIRKASPDISAKGVLASAPDFDKIPNRASLDIVA